MSQALLLYGEAAAYSDLALSARARLGRALLLYQARVSHLLTSRLAWPCCACADSQQACMQTGAGKQAIVELEGERLLTRASPEVDAALAAMLYVEQPERRTTAETLWDSAMRLDTRLSSLDFVANARRSASTCCLWSAPGERHARACASHAAPGVQVASAACERARSLLAPELDLPLCCTSWTLRACALLQAGPVTSLACLSHSRSARHAT